MLLQRGQAVILSKEDQATTQLLPEMGTTQSMVVTASTKLMPAGVMTA